MIIEKIQTTIREEELNPVTVVWDLEITPPENEGDDEQREVAKIHSVRIDVFEKHGVDATDMFTGLGSSEYLRERLKVELLEVTEYESIEELKTQAA